MKKIIIIGGGVAAYEAAQASSAVPETQVTVCSAESVPPYRRPALSRMVAEEVADTAFYFKPLSFYKERGIDLRLAAEAEGQPCLGDADAHQRLERRLSRIDA